MIGFEEKNRAILRKILRKTTTYEELTVREGFNEDGSEREESEVVGTKTVIEIITLDGTYRGDEVKEKARLEREKRSDS